MNILFLTEEAISFSGTMVRGGQIHVRNVVSGLRTRGHDVRLIDWNEEPERSFQHSLSPRFRFGLDPTRTLVRAISVGRQMNADAIISKTRKTYLAGLGAAAALDIPHIVHVGSSLGPIGDELLRRLLSESFEARLRAPHDAYFVVCQAIGDDIEALGVDPDCVFDVKNAVDTDRFHPDGSPEQLSSSDLNRLPDDSDLRLGYVGGLHEYKGLDNLADALDCVHSNPHLIVAGDGPDRKRFERRFGSTATFLGAIPYKQIPAFYHEIDVLVLPSHTEGLPRVVLEAQATGTPVVATRVGGVPEVVEDGRTGLLCDARDPDCLAAAIDRLATDGAERSRLAEMGREAVATSFTWDSLYNRYERFLRTICDR